MSGSGSGLSGATGLWLAAGASVVIVGGAAWFSLSRQTDLSEVPLVPAAQPADEAVAIAAPTPDAAVSTAPAETAPAEMEETAEQEMPAPDPAPEAEVAAILPAFDEVRREADGMTIIAGRAAPGALLKVLQNGVVVANATADSSGKFATFLMIPPSGEGHVLSLEQVLEGEAVLASDDQIILAPIAVAEVPQDDVAQTETVVAEADPVPAAEAVPVPADEPASEPVAEADPAQDTQPVPAEVIAEATEAPAEAPAEETTTAEVAEAAPQDDPPQPAAAPQAPAANAPAQPADVAVAQVDPPAAPPASTPPTPAAPTASVVLKSTSDGVELLNTQAPEVMKRVALDTISYSDVGDVQLTGRAQARTQSVRVYLNNAPIASLPVDAAGRWRGDLPDIDEGIYTLRVDEVAQDGTVTSRVETPFKREDPAVLVQAAAEQEGPLKRITVQRGNTLWAIARERYGDGLLYVRVFEANAADIRDPDLIYPGQVFDLPD